MKQIDYANIDFVEIDEIDFRLGLNELLSAHGKIDSETHQLIDKVIAETKQRAMKDSLRHYIEHGQNMSLAELKAEDHRSARLGKFLESAGYSKPDDNFEAHALVSGGHPRAMVAREILASFNIRIDEPANGLWLPNFKRNLPLYPDYNKAHRSLHKKTYYLNITACLEQAMNPIHARSILRRVAQGIVTGGFPIDRRIRTKEIMGFVDG